jgi:hypothetical protein
MKNLVSVLILMLSLNFNSFSFEKDGDIPNSVIALVDSACIELSNKYNVNLKLEKITDKQSNRKITGWIFAQCAFELAGLKQIISVEIKDTRTIYISMGNLLILSLAKAAYPEFRIEKSYLKNEISKRLKFIRILKIQSDYIDASNFLVRFYDKRLKKSFNARFFIGLVDVRSNNQTHVVNINLGSYEELLNWDFELPSRTIYSHKLAFVLQTNEPPPDKMIISHIYLFDVCNFELKAMYSTCVYNSRDVIQGIW